MHHFITAAEQIDPSVPLPLAADEKRAADAWTDLMKQATAAGDDVAASIAAAYANEAAKRVLDGVFGCSPFLAFCAQRDPVFFRDLLERGPDAAIAAVMDAVSTDPGPEDAAVVAKILRQAKRRIALGVALADISGAWNLEQVTGALSAFAEAALGRALCHLLRQTAGTGAFQLAHEGEPQRDCGLIVLGMGKLGGRELNYSSDIDLIVLFDPDKIKTDRPEGLGQAFVRLTRALVKLMEDRTADGYVFRTDLRLRPDPGATPPALSVAAAEVYYEGTGQNWERAAMIKARPVAGDIDAGTAFLKSLVPFIWRKNLDFAAIQDIHSIKRQINAHKGGSAIAVAGHNVKLGRGGIREIEFYAQTQQLIWGGRVPDVRVSTTRAALDALVQLGQVERQDAEDLLAAYRELRRIEHRLQMIADEQTHSIPSTPDGIKTLACFLGYADADAFSAAVMALLHTVEDHYAALFEEAPSLSAAQAGIEGNLVFTGGDTDPGTLDTLRGLGFANPEAVDATVRGWHHGRYRATRSERTRGILTELMPAILSSLGKTADPDAAFRNFDAFLSRLPAGVQLFSMFHSHPDLLELVAEIMGGAPRLSDHLAGNAPMLESVLTPAFYDPPPPLAALRAEIAALLDPANDIQDVLDQARRWAHDRQFQIGVQALKGLLAPRMAAHALSDIADAAIEGLYHAVAKEFARLHGTVPGGEMVIVGLGKLGSRELTPESDLDMIYVYNAPTDVTESDGPKPLAPSQYFARLSQRLINAIAAPTAEGTLYEVDMRLRPSGTAGPIATSFDAFLRYHQESAWTWEHMALTRARVVCGPPGLRGKVEGVVRDALTRPRDPDKLVKDVAEMRQRIDAQKHTDFIWDVKHIRGGLVDAEFLIQYLLLRHAHEKPAVLAPGMRDALDNLIAAGVVSGADAEALARGLSFWQGLQLMLRLSIPRALRKTRDHDLPQGLQRILVAMTHSAGFDALKDRMEKTAATILAVFDKTVQKPADSLGEVEGSDLNR